MRKTAKEDELRTYSLTEECPGSGTTAAAPDAHNDAQCPDCGAWLPPVPASVKRLKVQAVAISGRTFEAGTIIGKVQAHRRPTPTDRSKR